MKTHEYSFESTSGLCTIKGWQFAPEDGNVKAVIQLHHGMAEHCGRYIDALEGLTQKGYAVFMHDMLNHGKSNKNSDELGYFGDKNGYKYLIKDAKKMFDIAKNEYPNLPFVIAGHSMGSFVMRLFATEYPNADYDAAIFIGTSGPNPLAQFSIHLTNVLAKLKGTKYRSKFLENTGFKGYNDKFEKDTDFDWLSRSKESVKNYINDDFCGYTFTIAGYNDLAHLVAESNSPKWYASIKQHLPIMIITGELDPVGGYTQTITDMYDKLKATNHSNLDLKIYPNCRHEVLNELNKEEVYSDIDSFICQNVLKNEKETANV